MSMSCSIFIEIKSVHDINILGFRIIAFNPKFSSVKLRERLAKSTLVVEDASLAAITEKAPV